MAPTDAPDHVELTIQDQQILSVLCEVGDHTSGSLTPEEVACAMDLPLHVVKSAFDKFVLLGLATVDKGMIN